MTLTGCPESPDQLRAIAVKKGHSTMAYHDGGIARYVQSRPGVIPPPSPDLGD